MASVHRSGVVRFASDPPVWNSHKTRMADDEEVLVPRSESLESGDKNTRASSVVVGRKNAASNNYKIAIAVSGIVIIGLILFAAFSPRFVGSSDHKLALFTKKTLQLRIYRTKSDENPVLELALANGLDKTLQIHGPYLSSVPLGTRETYQWRDFGGLSVANMTILTERNSSCVGVSWSTIDSSLFQPAYNDCIALGNSHWYGGGELYTQVWPLETGRINSSAFVSHDILNNPTKQLFGSVLQPLFVSSDGVMVIVNDGAPLFVSLSPAQDSHGSGASLCLQSRKDEDIYPKYSSLSKVVFSYSVCMADDLVGTSQFLINRGTIPKPVQVPNAAMMRKPIWATGGSVAFLNQTNVRALAQDIISHAPAYSALHMDNKFVKSYGDFVFNNVTFPRPSELFSFLKSHGFQVTLWESLFVNVDSENFDFAVRKGYLVRGSNDQVNLVQWWNGLAGVLDVTSPNATTWFLGQLRALLQLGVDSFQFHGGEAEYLPLQHVTHVQLRNPNIFSTLYAEQATPVGGDMSLVRGGYQTQGIGHFVALMDKSFSWGLDNGLHSILTGTLTLSVLGYPFVVPDVIGANVAVGHQRGSLPNAELFIRWVQLTAFLPVMQFSTPPWWYANSTVVDLSWRAVELHGNLSQSVLEGLATNAVAVGEPIIRPLWWIAPKDEPALVTNTQFLVGNDLMVAAVVQPLEVARKQHVYVPAGSWQHCNGTVFTSSGRNFTERLSLNYIPYFCRLSSSVSISNTFCTLQPCR